MIKGEKRFNSCVEKFDEQFALLKGACDDFIKSVEKEFCNKCEELYDDEDDRVIRPDGNWAVCEANDYVLDVRFGDYLMHCNYVELNGEFIFGDGIESVHYDDLSTIEKKWAIEYLLDFINS